MIHVENLTKHYKILNRQEGLWGSVKDLFSANYRTIKAVDDISFNVSKGEIVGFLGPNGAGKSTTIKMMTGILKPTRGKVVVNNFQPYEQRRNYVATIGTVFGQRTQLWWDIPVIESFKILKEIYRIPRSTYESSLDRFEQLFGISKFYNQTVRSLSLGQRGLCDIASSFLHNPSVVFLDEPSIGLDVSIKQKIRSIIRDLNIENKTTVFITSHDMGDIESLCKRVTLIDDGKIIYDGATDNFTNIFGNFRTLIFNSTEENKTEKLTTIKQLLQKQDEIEIEIKSEKENAISVTFRQDHISLVTLLKQIESVTPIFDFKVQEIKMEDIMQKVYNGALS